MARRVLQISLLLTFMLYGKALASDAELVKAAQDACSGLSSVGARSDRSTIKFDKYDLKVDGGGELRVEEKGVLLRKIQNFNYNEYSSCMKDLLIIMKGLKSAPSQKDSRLRANPGNFPFDEARLEGAHLMNNDHDVVNSGEDGQNIHLILLLFRVNLEKTTIFDKNTIINSLERPQKFTDKPERAPWVYTFRSEIAQTGIQWPVAITFEGAPPIDVDAITLRLGNNYWSIQFGPLQWQERKYKYGSKEPWFFSTATVEAQISKIDWAVIRAARFLQTNDPNVSLLEVGIHNLSPQDIGVNEIFIVARHPKSEPVRCMHPDMEERLTLNWEAILSSKKDAATISRSGLNLRVPVKISRAGYCSSYGFAAQVPIRARVVRESIGSIALTIRDIPPLRRPRSGGAVPTRLHEWFKVELEFRASDGVFRRIEIDDPPDGNALSPLLSRGDNENQSGRPVDR